MGEFGAFSKADMDSRIKWTAYCARLFESLGFSWSYWEFGAAFGIYNPDSNTWNMDLVNALISDDKSVLEMGEPEIIEGKDIVKNGDFSDGTNSWQFGAWVGEGKGKVKAH